MIAFDPEVELGDDRAFRLLINTAVTLWNNAEWLNSRREGRVVP